MMSTMKAIIVNKFGDTDVLLLKDSVLIPKLSHGQVLVAMHAAGVNPIDCYIRCGQTMPPPLPYTPGFDGAGIIEEVGSRASNFKKGDRVLIIKSVTGTYAQYSIGEESSLFKIPGDLSFSVMAAVGIPYFTAYHALVHKCHAKAGETVLVHGASGGVGIACCQIANRLGLQVFGTAGTKEGMNFIRDNYVLEPYDHYDKEHGHKIMESTGGQGIRIILEMEASANMSTDVDLCRQKGQIAIIGQRGSVRMKKKKIKEKEIDVHDIAFFNMTKTEVQEAEVFIMNGLKEGWLQPIVGEQFALENAADAHREVMEHPKGSRGKVILNISH